VEEIRVGNLEDFASRFFRERSEDDVIPITPRRARAQVRNPCADPGDIGLFVVYSGSRLIGYQGVLPGRLRRGGNLSKVYWGSTWYLHPDFRRTAAGFLMGRHFGRRLSETVYTDVAPAAGKLILRLGASELGSYRYWRLNLKKIPGSWRGSACRLFTPAPPPGLTFRPTVRVREEAVPFVTPASPPAEFYRGPKVVNWMLEYPWVSESADRGEAGWGYLFTHRRRLFRMTAFEIFGGDNDYRGYLVLSLSATSRERTMKILDYRISSPGDVQSILPFALRRAGKYRADIVNIPGELISSRARRSLLFRFARTRRRPYLGDLRNPDSPLAKAAGEIRLQYCDGDTAFT